MSLKHNYHVFSLIAIFMWALGFVFTRLSVVYFHPFSVSLLRFSVASVALLAAAVVLKIKPPDKEDWKWFVLCGLSGFGIYMPLFTIATTTLTAATSSMVVATVPILTSLLAWFVYKERLKKVQCFACGLEYLGILVMAVLGAGLNANLGVLILSLATGLLAVYNITTRRLIKKYSPLQVTVYSMFVGTLVQFIFIPYAVADISQGYIPFIGYFYIIVMGVFSSAFAFVAWSLALKTAPKVSYATNYMFGTPFLTTVLGFWLANELPGLETLFGGILIFSGLIIFNFHGEMAQLFGRLALRSR